MAPASTPVDITVIEPAPGLARSVSWGAIFAGAIVAAGLTIFMMVLGAGFGLSIVSPWPSQSASVATFAMSAIIWLVATQWVASLAGGYIAGRLSIPPPGAADDEERSFRDMAHGLATWAVATVVAVFIASSAGGALVGAGASVAGAVGTGAAATAAAATGGAAAALGDDAVSGYFVDTLFRAPAEDEQPGAAGAQPAPAPAADAVPAAASGAAPSADAAPAPGARPAAASADGVAAARPGDDAVRGEAGRILLRGLAAGEFAAEDRTYLASLIAEETGVTPEEATARIDGVISTLDAATAEAQAAAETAREAAATLSYLSALALIVGAFMAVLAGYLGGNDRDRLPQRAVAPHAREIAV